MALMDNEFARRDPQGVELRPTPARLAWRLDGLGSSDDHELRVRFLASAQVPDDATDRRLFAETLLTTLGPLTLDTLAEHLRPAILSAARDTLRGNTAAHWLDAAAEKSLCDVLHHAARQAGFSCGVQILPPFLCEIRSPSYEREQRATRQVTMQTQSLARATQLLEQFNSLRNASPEQSAGQLLSHLSPAEQSEMLTALLAAGTQSASPKLLYAVSGTALLRIDPRNSSQPEIIANITDIGPLRSISVAGDSILLGGQRGIAGVNPQTGELIATFAAPVSSDFGFNAAIRLGDGVYATHVEAGLLRWKGESGESEVLFRSFIPSTGDLNPHGNASVAFSNASVRSGGGGVTGPRHLAALNANSAIFAHGAALHLVEHGSVRLLGTHSSANVIALLPMRDSVIVVRSDGMVQKIDRDLVDIQQVHEFHRDLRAATLLPWMNEARLLVADKMGIVDCVGMDDAAIVRFHSPNLDTRMLAACEDHVAAVASDRQRVQFWSLANPQAPARQVHVASLTRHRIAAIAFV